MGLSTYLLSVHGRISRRDYWLRYRLPSILLLFGGIIVLPPDILVDISPLGIAAVGAGLILAIWIWLVGAIKRSHDRDRPGFFILLYLVPMIGQLWLFIELGCMRGTVGANRFGQDPLRAAFFDGA